MAATAEIKRLLTASANAQKLGRLDVAEHFARQALDLDGDSVSAKFLLGTVCARKGESERAISYLCAVLRADPNSFETLISLAEVYREVGRLAEAIELGLQALRIRPQEAAGFNALGRTYMAARQLEEAAGKFQTAIALKPDYSAAYYNLGKSRQLEGRDGEAAEAFIRAAGLLATLENMLALGQSLLTLCEYERALACARDTVARYPNSAAAHLLLCGALIENRNQLALRAKFTEPDEAETELGKAISLDSEHRESLQIAVRQRLLGHLEAANAMLREAIFRNPNLVAAYEMLIQNKRVTEEDRDLVSGLRNLLETQLSPTEACSAHYGLAKALEDLGDYRESMEHYNEANRITRGLKFGTEDFDRDFYTSRIDWIIEHLALKKLVEGGSKSDLPVLIIGMMRSGTTLAEQILSSHPDIAGAGELRYWSLNWRKALNAEQTAVDEERAAEIGAEYVESLRGLAPEAARIVDKMPGNYMFAGLIHASLPNARLIHIRRNPADTCLSIWATPNHMPHEGGNDKSDIVFVYRQYQRLMECWLSLLPRNRFMEIDYEELVNDKERVTRTMIDFCGVDWDDSCLAPEHNRRIVATPSLWQVRQPVYKTSVERWRKFEPYLGEFSELVEARRRAASGATK